jgi:hypothetical protein
MTWVERTTVERRKREEVGKEEGECLSTFSEGLGSGGGTLGGHLGAP